MINIFDDKDAHSARKSIFVYSAVYILYLLNSQELPQIGYIIWDKNTTLIGLTPRETTNFIIQTFFTACFMYLTSKMWVFFRKSARVESSNSLESLAEAGESIRSISTNLKLVTKTLEQFSLKEVDELRATPVTKIRSAIEDCQRKLEDKKAAFDRTANLTNQIAEIKKNENNPRKIEQRILDTALRSNYDFLNQTISNLKDALQSARFEPTDINLQAIPTTIAEINDQISRLKKAKIEDISNAVRRSERLEKRLNLIIPLCLGVLNTSVALWLTFNIVAPQAYAWIVSFL